MELYQTAITGVTLKFSEGVIAVNLPKKKGNTPAPDVILQTYPVPVGGWSEDVEFADEQCVFFGPGEYEKGGLHIYGFGTDTTVVGGKSMPTTSWLIDDGAMRCLVLGNVAGRSGVQKEVSVFGDVDVLVCFCLSSLKGEGRLDAAGVAALGVALQVRRVVLVGDDVAMQKRVAKEFGDSEEVVGKYVLKKKDLQEGVAKTVLFV